MFMRYIISILLFSISSLVGIAQDSLWVLVNIPVACIREGRANSSELSSQAVMGTPMLVLEDGEEWLRVQGPDRYEGFVNISNLHRLDHSDMLRWRHAPRVTVMALDEPKIYADTLDLSPRGIVSQTVNGSILEGIKSVGRFSHVSLPDGRSGWISSEAIVPIEEWASTPYVPAEMVERCYTLMGAPYLWGGASGKSVDCSGLVRFALYGRGVLTLRDAREQIGIGLRIAPEDTDALREGDLLFFSAVPDGRITHVAVYDCDGRYIHSSGRVKTNRMSPDDPDFSARYYRGASRIDGMIGTDGIWQIADHPWYF